MTDHIPPPPGSDRPPASPGPPPFGVPSASEVEPSYSPPTLAQPVKKKGVGGRIAAAVVGVAVLGGGLAYAVTQAGSDGASSPEAAAEQLFEAISNEDLIGVMELLPPGERRAFQDPIEDLADELRRLGVLSDGLDLSSIGGIDLSFEDLEFRSEELGDGVARVSLEAGQAAFAIDPESLPLGEELVDLIEELSGQPLEIDEISDSGEIEPDEETLTLVAVEADGSWRISLLYSITEAARSSAGLPVPDFGNGIEAVGHDSPEDAVRALLESALALDVESVIGLLPPDEMAVLHDYAPLLLDDLDLSDPAFSGEIDELSLASDRDGDTATVTIEELALDLVIDGEPGTVAFDGDCFTVDHPGGTDETCADDMFEGLDADELPVDMGAAATGIATVEVDGQWYVSPTRTLLGGVVATLRALDDDALEQIPDLIDSFFSGFDEMAGGSGLGGSLGGVIGGELDQLGDEVGIDDDFGDDEPSTGGDPGGEPSRDVLVAMLIDDQGFTPEEAGCIADGVYAAGFDDGTLATLQTGEIPEEVEEQIFAIVDSCYG